MEGDAEDFYKGYMLHPSAFPYPNIEESTIHRRTSVPLFFQERSSLIGLSILVHKLAVELKGKLQDDIPVSALYVKNAIVLQMESMQHVSRSGEKGGPSDLSDGG